MDRAELESLRDRSFHFNPGVLPPSSIRVAPYPLPLVLNEPPHDGERILCESCFSGIPEAVGFTAWSHPALR
jgi:hypothetical protein